MITAKEAQALTGQVLRRELSSIFCEIEEEIISKASEGLNHVSIDMDIFTCMEGLMAEAELKRTVVEGLEDYGYKIDWVTSSSMIDITWENVQ